jgi:hypothetical protein
MHRAGIDRAFPRGGFGLAVVEIFSRVGSEFGSAARRAEMKGFAAVVEPVPAGRGINGHSANGIAHLSVGVSVMVMAGVSVISAATAGTP